MYQAEISYLKQTIAKFSSQLQHYQNLQPRPFDAPKPQELQL